MSRWMCPICERWQTSRGPCVECLDGKTRLQLAYDLIKAERDSSAPDRAEAGMAENIHTSSMSTNADVSDAEAFRATRDTITITISREDAERFAEPVAILEQLHPHLVRLNAACRAALKGEQ